MLSVIIPTIQKRLQVLKTLVQILTDDSIVDEIFIINNKPEIPLDISENKVRIYTPKENLYVNQSWNLGIKNIRNDNFALLNDDMLVCKNFCKMIVDSELFNNKNTGLIGIDPHSINQSHRVNYIDIPSIPSDIKPHFLYQNKYLNTQDWGIAIFGKKENFYTIPDDLKIIYGDNYLLYKNIQNNKQNYSISNLPINHIHSSSSASPEFHKIIQQDIVKSKLHIPQPSGSIPDTKKNFEFDIKYNKNICIIRLSQEEKNFTVVMKYCEENKLFDEEKLSLQILSVCPLTGKENLELIIKTIKADFEKSHQ